MRLRAVGHMDKLTLPRIDTVPRGTSPTPCSLARSILPAGLCGHPVFARHTGAHAITGPAIVEQLDTTTVIFPGQTAVVDTYGNLLSPADGDNAMTTHVDPVTLELIKGMMRSARLEMEALIERAAMSPFIREKKDYFTAFFDSRGVCSMAPISPWGAISSTVFWSSTRGHHAAGGSLLVQRLLWLAGGVSHSPDMNFVAPVFHDQHLVGFAQAWGHLWDIGGMMPGSISPAATEVFQEGIIMPPIRIYREGVLNDEVWRLLARNSRFPDILKGDLRAIMASCRLGKQRFEEIFSALWYGHHAGGV